MYLTATNKLKARITECGFTIRDVADAADLSYQGFLNKLHNRNEFKAGEIHCISKLLQIEKQKDAYFFDEKVAKTASFEGKSTKPV